MIIRLKMNLCSLLLLIAAFILEYQCYEKTLRKIVRNRSKMEQRPISDNTHYNNNWNNDSKISQEFYPGFSQVKSVIHKMQRSKISTILSSVDNGKSKTMFSRMNIAKNENMNSYESRTARDALQNSESIFLFDDRSQDAEQIVKPNDAAAQLTKSIPVSRFFAPIHDSKENDTLHGDNSDFVQEYLVSNEGNENSNASRPNPIPYFYNDVDQRLKSFTGPEYNIVNNNNDLLEVSTRAQTFDRFSPLKYPYLCLSIKEITADIDAQAKFLELDLEPKWIVKKQFWNDVYDSRYESLMRNPKWPPLKVILIPRSSVHSIWKRPFENLHNDTVHKIISNIVKKLQFYPNLTFSWNEVSHLAEWWKTARQKTRTALRRLVNEGRFEITTGGWVETEESTSHLFGIIHQLIEGHQWLQHHLHYIPKVGWLTETFSHSPTLPYLLSQSEISNLVISNLHYSWQQYLSEYQYTDFLWIQNWDNKHSESNLNVALHKIGNDRYPKNAVLTHYLQFNTAGFRACGPRGNICDSEFNFANINNNVDINTFNVKEKSEKLLEEYSKTGTTSTHNVIIAPVGDKFTYEFQTEFDYQFNNYQKMSEFVNINKNIYKATMEFGTTKDYFDAVIFRHKSFPTLKGDFLNFADISRGNPTYWTELFTTRPMFKVLLRRIQATLRSTEILFSFALNSGVFKTYNVSQLFKHLLNSREVVARLQDKHVVSGTLTEKALRYVHTQILNVARDCWFIQEVAASLLSSKPDNNETYLEKFVYREGEFISSFKSITYGDQIYIFNSLNQERVDLVELISRNSNIRVVDHNDKDLTIQINPIWKYTNENKIIISRQFFKIIFSVTIPPLALKQFKMKKIDVVTQSVIYCMKCEVEKDEDGTADVRWPMTGWPFNIIPLDTGDIQLENYVYKFVFDEYTGFLKSVVEKTSNKEKAVVIDFGAFNSSYMNANTFLVKMDISKPPQEDILLPFRVDQSLKTTMIVSGQITTELVTVYGKLLQHTVKLFNIMKSPLSQAIKLETKVDYESLSNNREHIVFLSVQTDISNGNPPKFYIDNNGFQYNSQIGILNKPIESNIYPMTNMMFIEDNDSRLTVISDYAQGVTSLQEGHAVFILDRRILNDEGRGSDEGATDGTMSFHVHFMLLENFVNPKTKQDEMLAKTYVNLPSLTALYLASNLNYPLDIYFIDLTKSNHCFYGFLPLIKTSLPCDLAIINYRVVINRGYPTKYLPNTALMTIHRQSFSCGIEKDKSLLCSGEEVIFNKVFRNIKAVYQTNLVGTNEGTQVNILNKVNLPPMEITTLRIHY